MSYYWYDPEVPAGYQDADIEMRELEAAAEEAREEAIRQAQLNLGVLMSKRTRKAVLAEADRIQGL